MYYETLLEESRGHGDYVILHVHYLKTRSQNLGKAQYSLDYFRKSEVLNCQHENDH